MRVFPSHREVRRARLRFTLRFYAAMAMVTLAFAAIVAGHYLLGWW
jgi:hypothetical protein